MTMWFSFLCYSTLCLMNGKLRLLVSITLQVSCYTKSFFFFCISLDVPWRRSAVFIRGEEEEKNKIWRSCGLSFSTCVRSSSGARTLSAVGLELSIPSVLKYERPYFFVVFGNGHPSRFKTVMALMVVVVVQALPIYLSVLFFAFFSLVMRV